MKRRIHHLLVVSLLVLMWGGVESYAYTESNQDVKSDTSVTENFKIHYRVYAVDVDLTYMDNARQILNIRKYLAASPRIDSITIFSFSSPEGRYSVNQRLARKRGITARNLILSLCDNKEKLDSSKIKISPEAENWQGLTLMVEERYNRPDRDTVLHILKDSSISAQTRKRRLMALDEGKTWRYLIDTYMPHLRSATWVCVWQKNDLKPLEKLPVYDTLKYISGLTLAPRPAQDATSVVCAGGLDKKEILYVRTNLLSPVSNFGLQYCINDTWSVEADYYFPWIFRNPDHANCFQILGWNLGARYWLGRDRSYEDSLEGHSIGASLTAGYYDIERNFAGNQGEFVMASVDYLYSLPVFDDRLHVEFSIGLGYIYSHVKPYDIFTEGGLAFKKGYIKNFHWVGPTKASVSLVVPIKAKRRTGR